MKYQFREIIVEARQFDGTVESAVWFTENWCSNVWADTLADGSFTGRIVVSTPIGITKAYKNDWIVTFPDAKRWVADPHDFARNFTLVESA
jgi:hypothetical protein